MFEQLLFAAWDQLDGGFYHEAVRAGRRSVREASRPPSVSQEGNFKMVPAPGVVDLCPLALPRLCVRMQQLESRCTEFP